MKGNRDMFYQNYQAGGFGNVPMPSGYNINSQYEAYGPGVMQGVDPYEERISRIERQIRNIDQRLEKLELASDNTTNSSYMI